jgi:hypothetical protein
MMLCSKTEIYLATNLRCCIDPKPETQDHRPNCKSETVTENATSISSQTLASSSCPQTKRISSKNAREDVTKGSTLTRIRSLVQRETRQKDVKEVRRNGDPKVGSKQHHRRKKGKTTKEYELVLQTTSQ